MFYKGFNQTICIFDPFLQLTLTSLRLCLVLTLSIFNTEPDLTPKYPTLKTKFLQKLHQILQLTHKLFIRLSPDAGTNQCRKVVLLSSWSFPFREQTDRQQGRWRGRTRFVVTTRQPATSAHNNKETETTTTMNNEQSRRHATPKREARPPSHNTQKSIIY